MFTFSEPLIEEECEDTIGLKLLTKAQYYLARLKGEQVVTFSSKRPGSKVESTFQIGLTALEKKKRQQKEYSSRVRPIENAPCMATIFWPRGFLSPFHLLFLK